MSAQSNLVSAIVGHEAASTTNPQSAALFDEAARARENHWFRERDRELMSRLRKTPPAKSVPRASHSCDADTGARQTGLLIHSVAHSREDLWFHMHDHELIESMRKPGNRS